MRVCRDGVKSEFEEQLPLKEYAIRMPLYMAYRAPDILKLFVDSGRVKEMQVCAGDGTSGTGGQRRDVYEFMRCRCAGDGMLAPGGGASGDSAYITYVMLSN